jgi:anti-sigma regulatory factor (Ser/Thr protein kinase)
MAGNKERGQAIRNFILNNVEHASSNISDLTSKHFGISRQAVNNHIKKLVNENQLLFSGTTKKRRYFLPVTTVLNETYPLDGSITESFIWYDCIRPLIEGLPENVMDIWHHGITEIFNNAIDHSDGQTVLVDIRKSSLSMEITIYDNGEGIFKKIQKAVGLHDERHAVLELAKGKLTTDPENHSGEGIFFSSRMFDNFTISSGSVFFSHTHNEVEDWILQHETEQGGTLVAMKLSNTSTRNTKNIFDEFAAPDDYGFTKTVVPVRLAQYGDDKLISRSQAKRLLARIDRFETVIFDFDKVDSIGQAFADEIFRVFANHHPEINLMYVETNTDVANMIKRALSK